MQTGTIASPGNQQVTVTVDPIPVAPVVGDPVPVGFSIANPGSAPVRISDVTAAVTAITGASGTCDTSWFTVTTGTEFAVGGQDVSLPAPIPAGGSMVNATDWTLSFTDSGTDQSGCVGAKLTLTVTAS